MMDIICLQVSREQCVSLYWGRWPWREINLIAFSEESAEILRKDLQSLIDNLPQCEGSHVDYWLQCLYIELSRQGGGTVHALTALSSFGGVRLWRAYNVRICYQTEISTI